MRWRLDLVRPCHPRRRARHRLGPPRRRDRRRQGGGLPARRCRHTGALHLGRLDLGPGTTGQPRPDRRRLRRGAPAPVEGLADRLGRARPDATGLAHGRRGDRKRADPAPASDGGTAPPAWRRGGRRGRAVSIEHLVLISLAVLFAAFVQGATGVGFALIVAPVIGILRPELLPVCVLVLMLPLNFYV